MKEMETTITEKNQMIETLIENNKLNENFAQNSSKLLNTIRDKVLNILGNKNQNNNSSIDSKLWPQFNSNQLKEWIDFEFDSNILDDIPLNGSNKSEEMEKLKQNIAELMKENVLLKRDLSEKESIINDKNRSIDHLKTENETNLKKIIVLNNDLDIIKEKVRCSESVNRELKNIIDKTNEKTISTQNFDSLRLENASLKESLAIKEEMIDKLSAKYARNRKVWEENDRKATQEIKKLDDMVDHVIDTLKALPDNFKNTEPIQELLEVLSEESEVQNK